MAEDKKQDYFRMQLTTVIGVALAIILISGVGLYLLGSDIKGNAEHLKDLRRELLSRFKASESTAFLRRQSEQARSYASALENILISKDQLVNFSREINNLAKQSKIDLSFSFSGESRSTEKGLGRIELVMSATGSLDNFAQFLKNLEGSSYFVRLNLLDFIRQGDDKFKALINGNVFFFELD